MFHLTPFSLLLRIITAYATDRSLRRAPPIQVLSKRPAFWREPLSHKGGDHRLLDAFEISSEDLVGTTDQPHVTLAVCPSASAAGVVGRSSRNARAVATIGRRGRSGYFIEVLGAPWSNSTPVP